MKEKQTGRRTIKGANGLGLSVQTAGNAAGKPILFIHGFSQSGLAWKKQMESILSESFFLVAVDLRGHGLSDKPRDSYEDSKLWADDLNAVIRALNLKFPVLVGWSYAGIVISDYVRYYGEGDIAGVNCVGAVSRLGSPLVEAGFLGEQFLSCVPGFFSTNVEDSVNTLGNFVNICFNSKLSTDDFYRALGCAVVVPPCVRQALLARNINNDSVIASMRKPMLLSWGERDAVALSTMRDHLLMLAVQADAKLSSYPGAGHAPFWEAAERFNRELYDFRLSL